MGNCDHGGDRLYVLIASTAVHAVGDTNSHYININPNKDIRLLELRWLCRGLLGQLGWYDNCHLVGRGKSGTISQDGYRYSINWLFPML